MITKLGIHNSLIVIDEEVIICEAQIKDVVISSWFSDILGQEKLIGKFLKLFCLSLL